ncbi:MAG: proton-conducting transporter membrane subunit [Candidatus Omnitrophica bacterium]|nr:proton-conducting transporter membrane subunit [Candidatus Omnitrophota bacterium]
MFNNPLLILVTAPIAAGFLALAATDRFKTAAKLLAGIVTAACLAGSIHIFIKKPVSWYCLDAVILRADNLSAFIAMAVSLFAFLITVYSFGFTERLFGRYFGYLLMTLGASLGVLFANNFIVMIVFWGFLALMLYLLVNLEGTQEAALSSRKALVIIGGTDAVMILGIALIWSVTGTLSMDKVRLPMTNALTYIAYFSIVMASFAKAGAMPFHSWLPDVAEDAAASVSAYLPASLDKLLGIYLLARASLDLFITTKASNLVLVMVGAFTIIMAVMMALVQHNYKRLLGYHAVSQVGYMILGIGTGTAVGIAGGLFHMLNNAIYKSCLFLTAGAVEKRTKTMDLDKLGGLAKFMPLTFIACLVASLSISGIPPFNGFVSKWMIYQGIIESAGSGGKLWVVWLSAAMFGSALTIASFMKLLHAAFLGRCSDGVKDVREVSPSMYIPMLMLAAICVLFGVFAFQLPIPLFIVPSIAGSLAYIGTWGSILATVLILAGLVLGLFIYWLLKSGSFRVVDNFVGGTPSEKLPRISGTEFYNTIKDIAPIGRIYKEEESGNLDLYNVGLKAVNFFTAPLRRLHNGVLPTYLVWCFLGMIAMFLFLVVR